MSVFLKQLAFNPPLCTELFFRYALTEYDTATLEKRERVLYCHNDVDLCHLVTDMSQGSKRFKLEHIGERPLTYYEIYTAKNTCTPDLLLVHNTTVKIGERGRTFDYIA